MKQFSSVVAKIKNSDGVYESIPALRGMSSYEVAKEAGFEGTEQEWLEFMFDDGWVAKFQELENKKANKTDVYTKTENLSGAVKDLLKLEVNATPSDAFTELHKIAVTYQEPWNVDENVGAINHVDTTGVSVDLPRATADPNSTGYLYYYKELRYDIPIINSGNVKLNYSCSLGGSGYGNIDEIFVEINGIRTEGKTVNDYNNVFTVSKNDVLTIVARGHNTESNHTTVLKISNVALYANINTPYKYIGLNGSSVSTDITDIINTLLGVDE